MPVMNLAAVRNRMSGARIQRTEDTRYTPIPMAKTFYTPYISAILPNGTRKTAAERKKTFVSQPRDAASAGNSFPMAGSATTRADTMKGARADPRTEAVRTFRLPASDTGVR